jgi:hypothetical protein
MSDEDYAEVKKWIRLANILPRGSCKFLPEFRKFHDTYGYWCFNIGIDIIYNLRNEVVKELETNPITEDEIKIVSDAVIRKAMRWGIE